MAKQSMKNRELKRQRTVAKFAQKRAALKARNMLRQAAMRGDVPGLVKASW